MPQNQYSQQKVISKYQKSTAAQEVGIKGQKPETAQKAGNKLRCMTCIGQKSSGILTDAYTFCVRSRQYFRAFLSDTRHTSFYASFLGWCKFTLPFMPTS